MTEASHRLESPFPIKIKEGTVIDEKCRCGHHRTGHADTAAYGHGACEQVKCPCEKFTWVSWIMKIKVSPIR